MHCVGTSAGAVPVFVPLAIIGDSALSLRRVPLNVDPLFPQRGACAVGRILLPKCVGHVRDDVLRIERR
eukprot:scaffold122078_cov30-Tisochrysis_lutea.AAC.3